MAIRRYLGFVEKPNYYDELRPHFIGYIDSSTIEDAFIWFFHQIKYDNTFSFPNFLQKLNIQTIDQLVDLKNKDIFILEKEFIINLGVDGLTCCFPAEFDFAEFLAEGCTVCLSVIAFDDLADKLIAIGNAPPRMKVGEYEQ